MMLGEAFFIVKIVLQRYYKFLEYTSICLIFFVSILFFDKLILQSKEGTMFLSLKFAYLVKKQYLCGQKVAKTCRYGRLSFYKY